MKTTIQHPEKQYPYLAVFTMGEPIKHPILTKDIVLVSLIEHKEKDSQVYIQSLLGGKEGFITKKEEDYTALPKGTFVKIEN